MERTTRLLILDHIRKNQAASVRDISHALGMTGANIRHHLEILENNDLIEVVSRQQEGRGRPRQVYGLSRRVLGDGLDLLSGALLTCWLSDLSGEKKNQFLTRLAKMMLMTPADDAPAMLRIGHAIGQLNSLHYQARWEASQNGPRIILGHCPYYAIIMSHPELCQVDKHLLQNILGFPVEQTIKLQVNDKGLPYCSFVSV
jgi:predicted ArsR family transcriptional regulator